MKAKQKGAAEDKMVRQHHQLNGHEFEQTLGDNEGQGSLVFCSAWVSKDLWGFFKCEENIPKLMDAGSVNILKILNFII